jgi:predicted PurR-regulated permease PerM
MRIWNDYASYQWQSKVVGYNAESQRSWFQKIGLNSVYSGALALISGMIVLSLLYLGWIYWQRLRQVSELQRSLERFSRQLAPQLQKLPAETVSAWLQRLSLQAAADERIYFQQLAQLYAQYAYAPKGQSERNMREIKTLLKTCAYALKK